MSRKQRIKINLLLRDLCQILHSLNLLSIAIFFIYFHSVAHKLDPCVLLAIMDDSVYGTYYQGAFCQFDLNFFAIKCFIKDLINELDFYVDPCFPNLNTYFILSDWFSFLLYCFLHLSYPNIPPLYYLPVTAQQFS